MGGGGERTNYEFIDACGQLEPLYMCQGGSLWKIMESIPVNIKTEIMSPPKSMEVLQLILLEPECHPKLVITNSKYALVVQ